MSLFFPIYSLMGSNIYRPDKRGEKGSGRLKSSLVKEHSFCNDGRMPRTPARTHEQLIDAAMRHFWRQGYNATSMDALVEATGTSRQAVYSRAGSKRELYRQGFAVYQDAIVAPALAPAERPGATLDAVAQFFETQITAAERAGLPGPGCLIANATTETAPHDHCVAAEVDAHHARLKAAFSNALRNENPGLPDAEIAALAEFSVVTAQGLWSMSRVVDSATPLRAHASTLLSLLRRRSAP